MSSDLHKFTFNDDLYPFYVVSDENPSWIMNQRMKLEESLDIKGFKPLVRLNFRNEPMKIGEFGFQLDHLRIYIEPDTSMYLLCNPTGRSSYDVLYRTKNELMMKIKEGYGGSPSSYKRGVIMERIS